MKKILFVLFCFVARSSCAQVVLDPAINKVYNNAIKILSADERKFVLNGGPHFKDIGFAIFSIQSIDTLNKGDLIKQPKFSAIHIFNVDTDKLTGKITQNELVDHNEKERVLPLIAKLNGDTLLIKEFLPFGSGFTHEIVNRKVKSFYNAYQKNEKIFRLKINETKTDDLNIPVKDLRFKLNSFKFQHEKTIYGQAEFMTSPFYEDTEAFKKGYIKMRIHYKYVFKITIPKSTTY